MDRGTRTRWLVWFPGGVTRGELAWLAAAAAVAIGAVLALLAFSSYENGYQAAASDAATAELAASRLNGIQSEALSDGRLPAGAAGLARQLLASVRQELSEAGPGGAVPERELAAYRPVMQADLRLVAAGLVARARRADSQRVDPAFAHLSGALRRLAAGNARAAGRAGTLAEDGALAAVSAGFLLVALLLLRFTTTRRALAAAEAERRVLRRSDRVKAELISVVSHDLRTPLTTILGYIEILADQDAGPLTSVQRRLLHVMRRSGGRLLAIVDDLLSISGMRDREVTLRREEMSLAEAAAHAVSAQREDAEEKRVSLSVSARPCPPVAGDRRWIGELLANLVSNAIKFTPAGGSVEVSVGPVDGGTRLEVSDTGPGISPDDQEHLFEQFFRSAGVAGLPGVGLGLAMAKAIADAHEADLTVRSILGQGATFQVDFPAAALVAAGDMPAGGVSGGSAG